MAVFKLDKNAKTMQDSELPIGKQNLDSLTEKEKEEILKAEEIYRKGVVSIRDIIAPSALEIDPDHLRLNEKFCRTLFVFTYPRFLVTGWFASIINLNQEQDIAFYVTPVSVEKILQTLKGKVAQIQSTIASKQEKGEVRDPMLETAMQDVEGLRDSLIQGTEKFFHFAVYITVYAPTKKELDEKTKEIESLFGHKLVYSKRAIFQMESGFNTTLPLGNDEMGVVNSMNTSPLSTCFPFVSSELTSDEGILYGINRHNNSLIIFDRFTLPNANSVIFATSGAGKSVGKDEPVLIKNDSSGEIKLEKIGNLVDKIIKKNGAEKIDYEMEGVWNPKISVYTFNKKMKGEWAQVTCAARKDAPNCLFEFTTNSGRKIVTTGDHNMLVLKNGKIETLKSEEVKIGDFVPLPRQIPEVEKPTVLLNLLEILKKSSHVYVNGAAKIINKNYQQLKNEKVDLKFDKYLYKYRKGRLVPLNYFLRILDLLKIRPTDPILKQVKLDSSKPKKNSFLPIDFEIKPSLIKLLGYIVSEGHINSRFILISNRDPEILNEIKFCLIDLKVPYFQRKDKTIVIAARVFVEVIKNLCGGAGKAKDKRVPSILFNLKNDLASLFLKTYFEGDGTVEKHAASCASASDQLISELSYLLFRFGIITRISQRKKKATNSEHIGLYYYLTISGQSNLKRFYQKIGFVSRRKTENLEKIINKKENSNVDVVPTIAPLINEIHHDLYPHLCGIKEITALGAGDYNPTPTVLKRAIKIIRNQIDKITHLKSNVSILVNLPSLPDIIAKGKSNQALNSLLWKELGQSWRLMKHAAVEVGCRNALKAANIIYKTNYNYLNIKNEIQNAFNELKIPLTRYNPSFKVFLTDRPKGDSSYKTVLKSTQFLFSTWQERLLKIEKAEEKLITLEKLANSDLFYDPIEKINKLKNQDKYVYDLTVDNEVFLAGRGGLFVHNSYAVKLEILRSLMFGTDVLVIDPENEYKHLCDATGGTFLRISLNSPYRINPFDLPPKIEGMTTRDIIRSAVISLKVLMRLMLGRLTNEEDAIIDKALTETYARRDITPQSDLSKVTPPTMSDFQEIISSMKGGENIVSRLKKYTEGTFAGLFNEPTNVELKSQFVVFSIRDLEEELRPLAMSIVLNYIWNIVRAQMKRRMLVVDEAWWMMQHEDSARFMYSIAKRCRKYYLGLTTISQDVNDFLISDYGKAIVTNASMLILLKQVPASIDILTKTFYLTEEEKYLLLESDVGEGIFFAGPKHVAIKIVASYAEDQLITTDPKQLLEIEKAKEEYDEQEKMKEQENA